MLSYSVNEETRRSEPLTVAELVTAEVGGTTGVAVAVNGEVVPASAWQRPIVEDDRVDILTAVQGG